MPPQVPLKLLVVILFLCCFGNCEAASLTIHPDRVDLLKNAVEWMTFRKNGVLMTEAQLKSLFLDPLKEKYETSKSYRAFVIAFQYGVLPRLVLNENDLCDPTYTLEYKHPFNNSVNWNLQNEFIFLNYDRRDWNKRKYCDYRQGLKCHPTRKLCLCPEGSVMEGIHPNSSVKRCLLQENEVCALIDLDHGRDPKHSVLASNLYQLIFNLERPPSCKSGTQCRFKDNNRNLPFCYSKGPWDRNTGWVLDLGDECSIGLSPGSGTCATDIEMGSDQPYYCYNFGPPRSSPPGTESRVGFFSLESGPFGLTELRHRLFRYKLSSLYRPLPLFLGFVHPRSVPLRGKELRQFYYKYRDAIGYDSKYDYVLEQTAGGRCSVNKTEAMEDVWRFFSGLEDDPPDGEDYVVGATKWELYCKLRTAIQLTIDWKRKVCRVHPQDDHLQETLRCVPDGTTDADGNDGTCQAPGNIDGRNFSEKMKKYGRFSNVPTTDEQYAPDKVIFRREDILQDHPEDRCLPLDRSLIRRDVCWNKTIHFSADERTFDWNASEDEPTLENTLKTLNTTEDWLWSMVRLNYLYLEERFERQLDRLRSRSTLKKGDDCDFLFEYFLLPSHEADLAILLDDLLGTRSKGLSKLVCGLNMRCSSERICECTNAYCSGAAGLVGGGASVITLVVVFKGFLDLMMN